MGFYTSPNGTLTGLADGTDPTTGAPMQNAEPGTFDILPEGYDFKSFDPAFPDAMVEPFKKAMLRGIASGLGVSYFTLANDLEAVNFSSARAGLLEERNHWMTLQDWLVEHLHIAVYRRWLSMADLVGRLPLSGPTAKYYDISFMPRRWQWVDPLKDVQANIEAIKWGLKSRTQVVAETGGDLEDIFDQLAAENRLAEEKDVEINPDELQAEAQQEEARPEGDTNDDNQY
jgi:lambda family phage portal protein